MANSSLYSAYKSADAAGGAYASSLQQMMGIAEEKKISRQSYMEEQEASDRTYGTILQGLGLVSTIAGGIQERKTAKADIARHTGGQAEQTVGETSIIDLINPFKRGEGGKIEWEGFGKAPGLGKGETAWGEVGERLGVMFGGREAMWEWEGKEYKESDLLAGASLSDVESIADVPKIEKGSMADEVGGIKKKTEVPDKKDDKSYVTKPVEKTDLAPEDKKDDYVTRPSEYVEGEEYEEEEWMSGFN